MLKFSQYKDLKESNVIYVTNRYATRQLWRETNYDHGEFVGNFEHRGASSTYELYSLDSADQTFVSKNSKARLSNQQHILRAVTPNMMAGGMSILVKLDLAKGTVAFNENPDENSEEIMFGRPVKAKFINWIDETKAQMGIQEKLEESIKVGDNVHVGHKTKGGSGVEGKVTKIAGDTVYIEKEEISGMTGKMTKKTYKGQLSLTSKVKAKAQMNEHAGDDAKTALRKWHMDIVNFLKRSGGLSNPTLETVNSDRGSATVKYVSDESWATVRINLDTRMFKPKFSVSIFIMTDDDVLEYTSPSKEVDNADEIVSSFEFKDIKLQKPRNAPKSSAADGWASRGPRGNWALD